MKVLAYLSYLWLVAASLKVRRPGGRGKAGRIPEHMLSTASCVHNTEPQCKERDSYRSMDGVCNNLARPYLGAANSVIGRMLPAEYQDCSHTPKGGYGEAARHRQPRQHNQILDNIESKVYGCKDSKGSIQQLPNVREVSKTFDPDLDIPQDTYSLMVMQFGQFLDHDMALTPEVEQHECCEHPDREECFPIFIPREDPFYSSRELPQTCLEFTRSHQFCPNRSQTAELPREQFSIVTSFVDGSQIYSANEHDARKIRTMQGGELKTHADYSRELLPAIGGELTAGDIRALDMPGLTSVHTLFLREHNRIARMISGKYRSDEEIYQRARRVVVAQLQNIVYGEYLPVILGRDAVRKYGLGVDTDTTYNPKEDPSMMNSFATAAYRFGHSLIQGLVKMADPKDPESVIKTYQLHKNFFNMDNYVLDDGQGMDRIVAGLLGQEAQTMDRFVTEDVTNHLFLEVGENTGHSKRDFGADLVARNLQRGRDHGLPGYNKYRKFCGLKSLPSFRGRNPPEMSRANWRTLSELYKTPDDVDLFVGGLAEYRYNDGLTGPTFNCIKSMQFKKLMDGDRFFFTHKDQAGSFTTAQLNQLRKRTLRDIICENTDLSKTRGNVFLLKGDMINCTAINPLDKDIADIYHLRLFG